MKRFALIAVLLFLTKAGSALAKTEDKSELSCLKCHGKAVVSLEEVVKRSGAKSSEEFLKFLREKSEKKALHRVQKDEDVKKAFELYSKVQEDASKKQKR